MLLISSASLTLIMCTVITSFSARAQDINTDQGFIKKLNQCPTDSVVTFKGFSAPITITRGGIYTGNWFSASPQTPAIKIATDEYVLINNSTVAGLSDLISGSGNNIAIKNTRGIGVGLKPGKFVDLTSSGIIDISDNKLENVWGIRIHGRGAGIESGQFTISRNFACNLREGLENRSHFIQVVDGSFKDSQIYANFSINFPGKSKVEDVINIYNAQGRVQSPIKIEKNFIFGAFPSNPQTDGFSGGGIIVDGGNFPEDVHQVPSYIAVSHNCVINTSNYGIAIAAGHDNILNDNIVYSSGSDVNGGNILSQNVGIYIWDTTKNDPNFFYSNTASQNFSFWRHPTPNREGHVWLNNYWMPGCAKSRDGSILCTGNATYKSSLSDSEAQEIEKETFVDPSLCATIAFRHELR